MLQENGSCWENKKSSKVKNSISLPWSPSRGSLLLDVQIKMRLELELQMESDK